MPGRQGGDGAIRCSGQTWPWLQWASLRTSLCDILVCHLLLLLEVGSCGEIHPQAPRFMTWLLYVDGNIFKILHTKFIFREIIVRTRTAACELQTETESVGI